MSNPNEDQWNGQTGQPNQSQPNQPNPAGQPGQPQYGAYDSNHGGQYPPQGAPGAQDTQNQHAQNGQPQGEPNQNPYYGPYAYNPNYGPNGQPAWGPDGRRYQADGQSNSQADGQPNGPWGDQSQPGWQQTNWYVGNFSPFRLIEEWLPEKAKTKIRIIYGVVGVAAIALGAALLLVPNKTLALAALLLGVYFVISGVVRIVSALVEPGLPGGWRVLDVFVGILLTFGGVVVVRNYGMTGQTLALLITLMVGFGWINVMVASAMALHAGVPMETVRKVIQEFAGVEHRIEYVCEKDGVAYYNDSKGTNPDAAIKGIQAMNRPTLLIGGGYDKQSTYEEWIQAFDGKVRFLVLIGDTKEKIAKAARNVGFNDIIMADNLKEAVQICHDKANAGDAVLLSPACASWDQFKSYEQRGELFKEYVRAL